MKQSFIDNTQDMKKIDAEIKELSHLLPKDYKPHENEEYMNDIQKAYFKVTLLEKKLSILNNNNIDQEDYILEKNRKQLKSINSALVRLERDEYGYCLKTWDEIGVERLEANPMALYCIEYQELLERGIYKEVEEE